VLSRRPDFGERGIINIIGIIGYYDLVSMTLITMQAEPANASVTPLRRCRSEHCGRRFLKIVEAR
jgi:hypothetical protein